MKWKSYFYLRGFGFKFIKSEVWYDEDGLERGMKHLQIGPFNWVRKIKYESDEKI